MLVTCRIVRWGHVPIVVVRPKVHTPPHAAHPTISTVTKTILYPVCDANKERGAFLILLTIGFYRLGTLRGGMWRHIDWISFRRNNKREVMVVVVCGRWKQVGLRLFDIAE